MSKITLESLGEDIALLKEEISKLKKALKEATVSREVVEEPKPINIAGLSFEVDKTKFVFSRPSVMIEEDKKFVTYTAAEVVEDKALQKKFAELALNGLTTFVSPQI